MSATFDYVLVGGGLANGLIALALFFTRPGVRVALVEAGPVLGGDHLWCFHGGDIPEEAAAWVEPLVATSWDGWSVRFPNLRRSFDARYAAVPSPRLDDVVVRAFADQVAGGSRVFLDTKVVEVRAAKSESESEVLLADGTVLRGRVVVDARGPSAPPGPPGPPGVDVSATKQPCGWQKFLGLELEVEEGTAPLRPTVMDADVPQTDGFRFVYVLPLAPNRVMVEDTYYADEPHLDARAIRSSILDYARANGMAVRGVFREERGALPLPLGMPTPPRDSGTAPRGPIAAGYGGGLFHPTTGYSFPVAVRFACLLAAHEPEALFGPAWHAFHARHFRQARFAILLNQLLFQATPSGHRRDVLERFHRLPDATIRRFYALETTATDRARVVCGRPPKGLSLRAALAIAAPSRRAS